jgi:RNA polymerase sigma-70 factor, ECF subfamily
MRDDDVLHNNPFVSRKALAAIHGDVFGWALSRCDFDHAAAEDLMQQAYVELLCGRARFDNRSSLRTFVFAIVQKLASNRLRRIANRLRLLRNVAPADPGCHGNDMARADRDGVWRAVQALPARQRDIIELVFCRELTIEQASGVMGISVGSGRVHYDRAKKALQASLRDWVEELR